MLSNRRGWHPDRCWVPSSSRWLAVFVGCQPSAAGPQPPSVTMCCCPLPPLPSPSVATSSSWTVLATRPTPCPGCHNTSFAFAIGGGPVPKSLIGAHLLATSSNCSGVSDLPYHRHALRRPAPCSPLLPPGRATAQRSHPRPAEEGARRLICLTPLFFDFCFAHPLCASLDTVVHTHPLPIARGGRGGTGIPNYQRTQQLSDRQVRWTLHVGGLAHIRRITAASCLCSVDCPLASSCDRKVPVVLWAAEEPNVFLRFALTASCTHVQ